MNAGRLETALPFGGLHVDGPVVLRVRRAEPFDHMVVGSSRERDRTKAREPVGLWPVVGVRELSTRAGTGQLCVVGEHHAAEVGRGGARRSAIVMSGDGEEVAREETAVLDLWPASRCVCSLELGQQHEERPVSCAPWFSKLPTRGVSLIIGTQGSTARPPRISASLPSAPPPSVAASSSATRAAPRHSTTPRAPRSSLSTAWPFRPTAVTPSALTTPSRRSAFPSPPTKPR